MNKILNFFKIAFSSFWLWPTLLIIWISISVINYVLMKYFYELMIIDPKHLVLWQPDSYVYHSRGHNEGPIFRVVLIILFFSIICLFLSNTKKIIKENFIGRAFVYFGLYFILTWPFKSNYPGLISKVIDSISYSPIEIFMKDTKRDYRNGLVTTPFGKFQMFIKEKDRYDRLFVQQRICEREIQIDSPKCIDFPYRK